MKKLYLLLFSGIGLLLLYSTNVFAAQPKVYVGVADQYMEQINSPASWDYVRHNADGFYINFIELDNWYTQSILNAYAPLFTNKNAFIESDMNSTLANEQGYIDRLQTAGFKIPYTSLNYGWDATRAANLKNYNLLSGQSPRLNLVQDGPWTVGGNIAADNGENNPFTNAQYRSWINQADGASTDGPMGFWYTDNRQMKAGSYSMVKYAHSLGKTAFVMIAPYGADQASYDLSKFLDTGIASVRDHEDNDADPDVWGVFEYATSLPGVPEQSGGVPYNSTTGMAYYLIKHIKGEPGTLDLSSTSDANIVTGQGVIDSAIGSGQIASFNPSVPAGTVYHYKINLKNNSTWLDYAGMLKATRTGATAGWSVQFKMGNTDVTGSVLSAGGYQLYKNNRLNPSTTRSLDLYLTRTSTSGSADMSIDLSLLPHDGSAAMDAIRIAGITGVVGPAPFGLQYEAESAVLSGGATVATNHPGYTGTGFVAGYEPLGASTQFTVSAQAAGTYNVILNYSNGLSVTRTISLFVNGVKVKQLSLPATANWDSWAIKTDTIALNAGNNTIIYKYDSGDNGAVNLDNIIITPTDRYEAEYASLSGGAITADDHIGYTGKGFVAGYGTQGATTQFHVNATAGSHTITLRYSNGMSVTRTVSLYVNGSKIRQISLPATANWDSWADKLDPVTLSAGINTIVYKYDSGDNGSVNLDYIKVN